MQKTYPQAKSTNNSITLYYRQGHSEATIAIQASPHGHCIYLFVMPEVTVCPVCNHKLIKHYRQGVIEFSYLRLT